ncbi:succinyl-diaminopimelate desuccinylase [Sulfurospirillum diekertiae]|mgnify:CR=1 FL=1|uniref:Succinyl-diaminopimelate desuccinylase n=1 Tax=Sulfurospirillum diekertiae TaxID=1854492 RepID=A0A1Y0HKB9_9BACT|nr:succinyl-diaminopimelate desuccinylase [Sulfurospirillum diekertiae]ARU47775.1 Succinyl-diaminopimelate desuccinylase [Sulfurospirillum diekertiae]ASC92621.1 Succinyl-diaminopimelate desuccinylase [Sulfurospirillum diekertiae]
MLTTEELFLKLLRFVSVTPHDDGAFAFIKEYLNDFDVIEVNVEETKNLFLYKRFSEGPHLCFAGHIDVVPAGFGWQSEPFEPIIKEGVVYARGTQDMKSGVCAFLQALKQTDSFKGTLSVLLTSDEEGDAKHGTIELLKALKIRSFLPDYAIVAEPTSETVFGDAIKIGRRGSINGVIEITGKQGHAAYPEKAVNPVHQVASILHKLAGHLLDDGDEDFTPSQMVITDIRGGMEVTNVTPGNLKIMFNVRNSTQTDIEKIRVYVEDVLQGLNFSLNLSQSAQPFITCKDSLIIKTLSNALLHVKGKVPKLSTAGGTSDARFFGNFGVATVECGVVNDTIHAPNECCPLSEVDALVSVFKTVIENFKKEVL